MVRTIIVGVIAVLMLLPDSISRDRASAQQAAPSKEQKPTKDAVPEFASPELAVLDRFAGPWNVAESHFNARGEIVGSAKGIEGGAWILDRRALQRTYTSGEEGKLFRAIGMITWDAAEKQYEGTWFDNSGNSGPTALTGLWDEPSKTMTFTLTSNTSDGKPVRHKVIDRFLDEEHRVATTYKVVGNQVEKVIEVQFTRARPCPGNLGVLPENLAPTKP